MTITEQFLQAKRDNLASELTIKNYRIDLKQFLPLLFNKKEEEVSVEDLKTVTILRVRETLEKLQKDKGYTITTINRRMASFKALMSYYAGMYGFPNTIHSMKSFNDTRLHEVEFIKNEEVKKVVERAKKEDPKIYLIMGLLFNTGLRSAELLSLAVENVHEDCIIVEGKGGKMRRVDLNDTAKDCIKEYLAKYPQKEGKLLNMTYVTLRRQFTNFLQKCNIDCSKVHVARHSFTTNLIEVGGIEVMTDVAKLLGHSTTATLQKHYLGSSTKSLTVSLLN